MKLKNKEGDAFRRHHCHLPAYYYPTLDNLFSRFEHIHIENIYHRASSSAKENRGIEKKDKE